MSSVWVLYYERFDDFSIDSVYASEALASIARDVEVKQDMRLQGEGHVGRLDLCHPERTGWTIREYPLLDAVPC